MCQQIRHKSEFFCSLCESIYRRLGRVIYVIFIKTIHDFSNYLGDLGWPKYMYSKLENKYTIWKVHNSKMEYAGGYVDRFTSMKIFVRIIQLGSFTAVGVEMGMTQSAVSKKMAALETSLGATLLTRTHRQVLLTEVGTSFYEHCLSILNELDEAEAQAKDYTLNPKGNLRINVPVAFGRLHVSPHLPIFMKTYPDIRVDISALDRKIDLVADGFDLVIRIGELADSNLIARRLGYSPRVIVASPEYLTQHGVPRSLADLKQHSCLVYTGLATVNIWHFRHQGKAVSQQVTGSMQSNASDAITECLLSGLGIAVMPVWLIQSQLTAGSLVTILNDFVPTEFPINAVYPQNHYIPLKVGYFVNFMKDVYSGNPVFKSNTKEHKE